MYPIFKHIQQILLLSIYGIKHDKKSKIYINVVQTVNFLNVRFSSIYGERMDKSGIIWNLQQQAASNSFIKITNGNKVSFDFINVIDAAIILILAIESNKCKGILNAASGIETTLFQLALIIKKYSPTDVKIINEDLDF